MKGNEFLLPLLFIGLLCGGCKQNKNDVFPVMDFIKSQIADVDTSVYPIMRLVPLTDTTYDTTYVKRDDLKCLQKTFLKRPISPKNLAENIQKKE